MDVILTFSESAIANAIDRLAQIEALRRCLPAASFRREMRDAVKTVAERGYATADRKQQNLALAVFLLATADGISAVH